MSRYYEKTGVIFLCFICLLSGCRDKRPVRTELPLRPVKTVVVDFQNTKNLIVQTGEIRPKTQTSLSFRLAGRIISRSVDIGSVVNAGTVIAELDPRDSANQLRTAGADLTSAVAAEQLAKINLARMQSLIASRAIAQLELDQARANWQSSVSRLENAQIAVKSARQQLSYTRLTATESGVITTVSANPGQFVNAGQEVVQLASVTERDAVFHVPGSLLNQNQINPVITVSLLSDPSVRMQGHIRDISPQADPVTRTFQVRVALDHPVDAFLPGASVLGAVQLPGPDSAQLPAAALTSLDGQPAVYLVNPLTQVLRIQSVHVERYSGSDIFVSAGLKSGDLVVVAGVNKLRPGMKVVVEGNRS